MVTTGSTTLYRIVGSDPPTERDFWSHRRLGLRYSRQREHIATGLSMFDHERDARRTAVAYPGIGGLIAELRIPDEAGMVITQTGKPHHYTVWGDPELLLTFVVRVVSV